LLWEGNWEGVGTVAFARGGWGMKMIAKEIAEHLRLAKTPKDCSHTILVV